MPHGSHGPADVRRRTGAAPVRPPVQPRTGTPRTLALSLNGAPVSGVDTGETGRRPAAKDYEVSANYLARFCAVLNVP